MPSRSSKPKTKPVLKPVDLSDKQFNKKAQSDRNKMKNYGDVPDLRPRGKIIPPSMIPAKKPTRKT